MQANVYMDYGLFSSTMQRQQHNRVGRIIIPILLTLIVLIFFLFLIRLVLPRELDDLHPDIPCQPSLIKKSDVLWVIPNFNNHSIAQNQAWCNQLKVYNKSLQLHGYTHTYQEFARPVSTNDLNQSIQIFKACFNQTPTLFKAPQVAYSHNNDPLLKRFNLERKGKLNQIFHKVYHCNDSGKFSNTLINWF